MSSEASAESHKTGLEFFLSSSRQLNIFNDDE
jgi:hypothetical protein